MNMKNKILLAFALFCLATPVRFAQAAHVGETIHVKTLGLVCDFCAQAVEKTFGKMDEVDKIDVDLDQALITIILKQGQSLNDDTIRQKITDAGYNVESIHHMAHAPATVDDAAATADGSGEISHE